METQPPQPTLAVQIVCVRVRVCVRMYVEGRTASFPCLSGVLEGRRDCLPVPINDASLAVVPLFCFYHIWDGFPQPPSSPSP